MNENCELAIKNETDTNVINDCKKLPWSNNVDITNVYQSSYKSLYIKHVGLYKLYSFGNNDSAQLGLRKVSKNIDKPTVVNMKIFDQLRNNDYIIEMLSQGTENTHTFIVLKSDKLNKQNIYGFGSNQRGQLGLGKKDDKPKLDPILLTKLPVNDDFVTDIKTGKLHSVFLTKSGKVYTVGSYHWGQLGIRDRLGKKEDKNYTSKIRQITGFDTKAITNIDTCNYHTCILDCDGIAYACGSAFKKATFIKISDNIGNKIINITCGAYTICMLDSEYNVYISTITKNNKKYSPFQCLNLNNPETRIKEISCGYDHTLFLSQNNNIYSYGNNSNYQSSFLLPTEQQVNILNLISQKDDLRISNESDNELPIKRVIAGYKTSIIIVGNNE